MAKKPEAKAEQEVAPVAAPVTEQAPEVPNEETVERLCVARGKAVTSLRGIKADGDEVAVSDFAGGEEVVEALIERGVLVVETGVTA